MLSEKEKEVILEAERKGEVFYDSYLWINEKGHA